MANRGVDGQFLRCDRRDPLVRKVLDRLVEWFAIRCFSACPWLHARGYDHLFLEGW